jgi:hypothetical protein
MKDAQALLKAHKDFLLSQGPYKYFITYTSRLNIGSDLLVSFVFESIKRTNRKLFGKNYNRDNKNYLEGFAFVEKHRLQNSKCECHVHIIIKSKKELDKIESAYVVRTIKESVKTIKHNQYIVFDIKGIDIQACYDDRICEYCSKDVNLNSLDNYKMVWNLGIN